MVPRNPIKLGKQDELQLSELTANQMNEFSTNCWMTALPEWLVGYSPVMDVIELLSPNCFQCLGRLEEFSTFTWCDRCEIEVDFDFTKFEVELPK